MSNTGPLAGTVIGHAPDSDGETLRESDGLPGPYYRVNVDHGHHHGSLVYAETELKTPDANPAPVDTPRKEHNASEQ
jgi:hypothetical protein